MKAIESITIKNSHFFKEDFKVEFSNKLNCIMGGRGTGKSTILHFIKAVIYPQSEKDDTTYSLLKNNLDQGEIILRFKTKNNSSYDISKYFNDEPQPEDSITHESVNLKSILQDLSCDIYEAARIEEIGRKPEDRLKLIDKMLPEEAGEVKDEIKSMQITIEKNAQEIKTIKARYDQKQEKIEDFEPVLEEIKLHKKNKPKDLDDVIDKQFENEGKKQKIRRSEKKFLKDLINFQDEILMDLAEIKEKINEFNVNNNPAHLTFVNKTLMQPAIKIFQLSSDDLLNKIKTIEKSWTKSKNQCILQNDKLAKAHEKQTIEYNTIKKKIEKNRQYYTILEQLSKKEEHLKSLSKECKELERKKNKKAKERNSLINQLNTLKQKLYSNRLEIIQNLNNQFKGEIRIKLHIGGLIDEYEKMLRNSLRGSKIKYNELVPRIVKYFPPDKFAEIIHNKDKDKLKSIFHIDERRATTII